MDNKNKKTVREVKNRKTLLKKVRHGISHSWRNGEDNGQPRGRRTFCLLSNFENFKCHDNQIVKNKMLVAHLLFDTILIYLNKIYKTLAMACSGWPVSSNACPATRLSLRLFWHFNKKQNQMFLSNYFLFH